MKTQIKINHLSKTFNTLAGPKKALDDVSLEINEGECVVIGGENGSGKSVLMQIIAGLMEGDKAFVNPVGWKKTDVQAAVSQALEQTGLTEKADFPARFLSGGEKRRLAVACMLAMKLPIIILDEPYANLDFGGVKQVNRLIRQLKAEGKTVIILTHEIEKCLGLADRFVVLFRGKKVFDGTPGMGLRHNLEAWNIRNPLVSYAKVEDLIWE